MKKALITGITGQDGSYLAELLLGKGYAVYRRIRSHARSARTSPSPTPEKLMAIKELYCRRHDFFC